MSLAPGPELLVHSSSSESDERLARARGDLVRLVPGRYVRAQHWRAFDDRERYLMLSFAALSALRCDAVLSHASAAAFWGLPRLGPWPSRAQVTVPAATTSTANRWAYKHASTLSDDETLEFAGFRVTSPARTGVDLALVSSFRQSVVALDHGLHVGLFDQNELLDLSTHRSAVRGGVRAKRAIAFADARADRPGESLSRVVIHEGGFEEPELQKHFPNPTGPDAYGDFWWRGCRRVGEFDGEVKYRDARMRSGRSPEQVVIDEKNRENWLARQPGVNGVVRWDWRTVVTPGALARLLLEAGVPQVQSRVSRV